MDTYPLLRWGYPTSDICRDGVWGEQLKSGATHKVADFKASSDKGCAACAMVLELVEEFKPGWVSQHLKSGKISLVYNIPLGVHLVDGNATSDESFQLLYQTKDDHLYDPFYESTIFGHGMDLLRWSLKIVPDSGSEEAFVRASKWLSFCLEQHNCCKVNDAEFRPRRLLHVGSLDDGKPLIRLFEPAKATAYACLSYCWGTDLNGVLTTTTEKLSSHLNGIAYESLPKTIADAVIVCKNLKIPNLWVDSLCVIQDDADDWAQQSSVMGEIYAKCQLAIYARDPQSCKLGFLGRQRFGDTLWQRAVSTQLPSELRTKEKKLLMRMKSSHPERTSFALDDRGWCLQESLLPNRRLIFTADEMIWHCCSRKFCECGHSNETVGHYHAGPPLLNMKQILGLAKPAPHLPSMRYSHFGLLLDWEKVVIQYSARKLSDVQDKLSAIAGLAKLVLEAVTTLGQRQDSYLAGLWASNFLTGLRWQTPGGERQIKYRAPTWSWASIDGAVTKFQHGAPVRPEYMSHKLMDAKVLKVFCIPEKESQPTGRLKQGTYAALRGPVAKVQLATIEHETDTSGIFPVIESKYGTYAFVHNGNLSRYQVELDCPTGRYFSKKDQGWQCLTRGVCQCEQLDSGGQCASRIQGPLCLDFADKRDEYACLRLVTWNADGDGQRINKKPRSVTVGEHIEPETCFLVLRKIPGEQEDVYTRIGIGFCSGSISGWTRHAGIDDEISRRLGPLLDRPKWAFPLFEYSETKTIKIF